MAGNGDGSELRGFGINCDREKSRIDIKVTSIKTRTANLTTRNKNQWRDIYFTSLDGLKLYARHYTVSPHAVKTSFITRRPLVCLPDLLQNHMAFHTLALYMTQFAKYKRDVYILDFRGHGKSDKAENWLDYSPANEAQDVLDFIARINVGNCSILGTGRSGIIAMLIAAKSPSLFGSFVLNDIGPSILPTGLSKVREFADRLLPTTDIDEAVSIIAKLNKGSFNGISQQDWQQVALSYYEEQENRCIPHFDPRIKRMFRRFNQPDKMPDLWRIFMALRKFPLLALRGENSEYLTRETMQRMTAIHFWCEAYEVPAQGHSPLLLDNPTHQAIENFLYRADKSIIPNPFEFAQQAHQGAR